MDYLMGIDLGSTSLKAIVYDSQGTAVATGSRPTERFHPNPDKPEWTVWEPDQIWGGVAAAARDAVAKLDDPGGIKGVAVTGMGMDGVPVDEDGKWLYPFISWHDPRTVPQFDWWRENVTFEKTFSIGGNPVWAINSCMRILWMAEHEPDILAKTHKWLLIEDFVNMMLCGRMVTDYSMASCTALFDQKKLDWSDELLNLSGIDRELMPEVLPSGTPVGEIHAEASSATGIPEGTPVVLGGHDHICGALPVGVFRPGTVLNVTGTWETVLTAAEQPELKDELRQMGVTVQAHVARGMHAVWGSNAASEMVEWYRKQFGHEARQKADNDVDREWEHFIASAAESPVGARGVMFLPHMSAVACPVVDEHSAGAFIGLKNTASAGDMLRAVFEGLCFQTRDVATALGSGLAVGMDRFVAVGGAIRNEFWMQCKADVMGRPVEVPDVEEATPMGAAIMAGIGTGVFKDETDALDRVYREGKVFQPNPEAAAKYDELFKIYKQIYPAISPISHQLG